MKAINIQMSLSVPIEEFTRPTLNLLLALSLSLNRGNIITNPLLIDTLQNHINYLVVEWALGNLMWRPKYFPVIHMSISLNFVVVTVKKVPRGYHCVGFPAMMINDRLNYGLCGVVFGITENTTKEDYFIAINTRKIQDYIIEWERNPTDSQHILKLIKEAKNK